MIGEYNIKKNINDFAPYGTLLNGGKGSGNFGHAGRPGKVGGSGKGSSSDSDDTDSSVQKDIDNAKRITTLRNIEVDELQEFKKKDAERNEAYENNPRESLGKKIGQTRKERFEKETKIDDEIASKKPSYQDEKYYSKDFEDCLDSEDRKIASKRASSRQWGYSKTDLDNLRAEHEKGSNYHRRMIEAELTDANFHSVVEELRSKKYKK